MLAKSGKSRVAGRAIALATLLSAQALHGCAAPPVKPFAQFAEATKKLEQDVDIVAADLQTRSSDRSIAALAGDAAKIDALRLKKPAVAQPVPLPEKPKPANDKPGKAQDPVPIPASPEEQFNSAMLVWETSIFDYTNDSASLVLQVTTFRAALLNYNRALSTYAAGLQAIADPKLIDDEGLNSLAAQTNGDLRAARDTLKLDHLHNEQIAIFTTAGTELFRAYLHSKQRAALADAMGSAQAQMPGVSRLGREACVILAEALWNEYDNDFSAKRLTASGVSAHGGNPPSQDEQRAAVKAILDLNTSHAQQLGILGTLHRAYADVPRTHEQLRQAAADGALSLDALSGLLGEVSRIDTLYQTLKKPDAAKNK